MGQPHPTGGPFHLPLSHGPTPSHPSFFASRPSGLWVVGSCCFQFPGVQALKGEARGGRSSSASQAGSGGRVAPAGRSRVFVGGPPTWGTWATANQRLRLWGPLQGPWLAGTADRLDRLTAPSGLPQPWPQATTWKCSTCRTSPSHTPGGILGTESCRLETGEPPLAPPAPQSQDWRPGHQPAGERA